MTSPRPWISVVVHDALQGLGQGRYVVELVRALEGRYQFCIYANRFEARWPAGVECRRIPAFRGSALGTVFSFLVMAEWHLRRRPRNLIHAQGLTSWTADVITAHICNEARQVHTTPGSLRNRIFPRVVAPIERAFYRSQAPRHAIAISQVVARELRDHYGWERPLTIIPHGVDTVRFRPVRDGREKAELRCRYGLGATDWVWIFVGEASKGARQAIRQLAHFPTAKLLVVSRSHREPYLQLAKELDVHDRLVWRGADPEPECAFRTADLFLYPSDYDAFGMVVTEAMASALPVVVGRDIGAAELLRHEQNGLLVDPSQAEQLCSAIALIQGEPARSKAMGEAGRHTALACSWKTCAERTAAVYDQLLTPGEKRGRNEISVP